MQKRKLSDNSIEKFKKTAFKLLIVIAFGIAFGYFEASVVVYLREIFYPDGFTFPLAIFSIEPQFKRLFLTETGREAASIVLIVTGAWLFGRNRRQRVAYFFIIFAIWDIFYYVWLKVILDWPDSIMDWDILFLIPMTWASPVLAPVLCSVLMLIFALIVLYFDSFDRTIKITILDWFVYSLSGLIIIVSFCIAGPYTSQKDFSSYFYWPLFCTGILLAGGTFIKCLVNNKQEITEEIST